MADLFETMSAMRKNGKDFILITVVDKTGEGPQIPGAKMVVASDGQRIGTVGGGSLEQDAYERALELINKKKSLLEKYDLSVDHAYDDAKDTGMVCGGRITLFYDYVGAAANVYLFGAGHVGRAVVKHLRYLGYHITVVDHREGIFKDFEGAHKTVVGDYPQVVENLGIVAESFVIIATPGHSYDYAVLKSIYQSGFRPAYIGLLSSKNKLKGFIEKLKKDFGKDLDLSSLYSPIGLDLGGATPDEIAVSILAEIQAVKFNRPGHQHLREQWYI